MTNSLTQSSHSARLFIEQLQCHAQQIPDQLAVRVDDKALSMKELFVRAERIAEAIRQYGCEPGDRIVVLGRPSLEWLEVMAATMHARCAFAPLSTALTITEQRALLADAQPALIFAGQEFVSQGGCSAENTVVLEQLDVWLDKYKSNERALSDQTMSLKARGDDLFSIIYSSGTTGVPKGIAHTARGRAEFIAARPRPGFGPGRVALVSTSLYTNFSFLGILTPLYYGAAVSVMSRFSVEGFLSAVEVQGITDVSLVPVQIKRIIEHPEFNPEKLSTLQFTMISGSPVDTALKALLADQWPGRVVDSYGTTETGGIATLDLKAYPGKLDTVGKIMQGVETAILSDEGEILPAGGIGEIAAKTPLPMEGYYNREDLTESLSWENNAGSRFIKTGDIGFVDEDGFLHITGRSKDMIISGGLNIYASDIEAVLCEHPSVLEAAVIAIPDDRWGECPYAIVVLRESACAEAGELHEWMKARLARTSLPAGMEFRQLLPRNDMGKVLKRTLREPFWHGREQGVA